MRTILILSALLLFSCKSKNQPLIPNRTFSEQKTTETPSEVSTIVTEKNIDFDTQSFLTIPHLKSKGSLRNDLLNAFVDSALTKKEAVVKNDIELDSTPMSEKELKVFKDKKQSMAKIVFSNSTAAEIYFVPANISLKDIANKLGLVSEADKKLKWMNSKESDLSMAGKTYYLINLNHEDLIKNDQLYYTNNIALNDKYRDTILKFPAGSLVQAVVQYQAYQETTVNHTLEAPGGCNNDRYGKCALVCRFTLPQPSGSMSPVQENNISNLNFSFAFNKSWTSVHSGNVSNVTNNTFTLNFSADNLVDKEFEIQFAKADQSQVQHLFKATLISREVCTQRDQDRVGFLQRGVAFYVQIKVFGRGEKLRQIEL